MEDDSADDLRRRREDWLNATRRDWYRVMRPLGSWVPWDLADSIRLDGGEQEDYFRPAARLDKRHLGNCRVFCDRAELLKGFLPKRGVVMEVGTDKGDFAASILEFSEPAALHIVDKTLANFRRAGFETAIARGTVRLHESDSVAAIQSFPDRLFDWIYIDADHSYDAVRRDLGAAAPKVKQAGFLVLNDYIFWSHREFMAYGVVQAVNEFCIAEDWEIVGLALHPEMHNDVALSRL